MLTETYIYDRTTGSGRLIERKDDGRPADTSRYGLFASFLLNTMIIEERKQESKEEPIKSEPETAKKPKKVYKAKRRV